DLSGNWRQRNTRTNEVHPLVWKIELLKGEGSQDRRNYEVTRYRNGKRFVPRASGRLYQSVNEALLLYDTPASMPRYDVSRIMHMRRLDVKQGCDVMKVLQIYDSWKGTRPPTNVIVMERLKPGRAGPVGSPVVKGRRPGWIKDRRPALPDNRLEQIERRERQRGR
ncbi:MAG: hypothetical protein ACE5GY_10625, partial [Thermodesulfobacteriota bacterium]